MQKENEVVKSNRPELDSGSRRLTDAFTLIELLVVVLIIAILAAVALPQYQLAVEKSRMSEAVTLARAIATAHQLYYLEHSQYLSATEIDKLNIQIPGDINTRWGANRIASNYFVYAPNGAGDTGLLALVRGINPDKTSASYYIYISQQSPNKIHCQSENGVSSIRKKLCEQLNKTGSL